MSMIVASSFLNSSNCLLVIMMVFMKRSNIYIYVYLYICSGFMRKIEVTKRVFKFEDEIEAIIEKRVTKFGTGAKLDCPKEYLGRRAYILISKD